MSMKKDSLTVVKANIIHHKSRIGLVFLLVVLMISVSAVMAQEGESEVDQPVREPLLLSEVKLPYGVQSQVRIFTTKDAFISSLNAKI